MMANSPRSAHDVALKCIPCNKPIVESTTGSYICVECGEVRIAQRQPKSITAERSGVRVEKTIEAADNGRVRIAYTIESTRGDRAFVTIADTITGLEKLGKTAIDPEDETNNWNIVGPVAIYRSLVDAGDTVETSHFLHRDDVEGESLVDQPQIEDVAPVDGPINESAPSSLRFADHPRAFQEFTRGVQASPHPEPQEGNGRRGRPDEERFSTLEKNGSMRTGPASSEDPNVDLEILTAIPAYNEAETIFDVVSQAQRVADDVIVVDDGSDDNTAERARRAGATVIEHDRNRGYGAALKTIFKEALEWDPDCLTVLDGDGQHDPSDVPKLVEIHLREGAEIVIGSRFVDGIGTELPFYRSLGIHVINVLTNVAMGVIRSQSYVHDTQSGFRLYNKQAISELAHADWMGNQMEASVDILFAAHDRGFQIAEVGVMVDYEVENPSSQDPISHGMRVVRSALKTVERERPLVSLGVPGVLVITAGLGIVLLTFQTYLQTGNFPVGRTFLAIFGTSVGTFACTMAIVLHALNLHSYREL